MRHLPFIVFDEVVELDEVDLVHAEARKRALQAPPGVRCGARTGLGGQEEVPPPFLQSGGQSQFRVAVRGGAEYHSRARVARPAELATLYHAREPTGDRRVSTA